MSWIVAAATNTPVRMTQPTNTPVADAADARQRLITAGIELFGRNGFNATSTRELAQRAGVNIAGIAYHFGGKERLYNACAEHIATTVRNHIFQARKALRRELKERFPEYLPASERG